ncbi:MAG: hypothetical protein ACLRFR_00820 [Clostridia bacterium]
MAITKSQQRKIKKYAKKIKPLTWILAIAFLAVGAGAGYLTITQVCKNDTIEVLGTKAITYTVGTGTTTYADEGIQAIVFGKDISSDVIVESNLEKVGAGYEIDLSTPGDYYIKYTINHFKFGTVVKYRTITVEEVQP